MAEDAFRQTLAPSQPALPGVAEVFRVVAPIAGAQEGADRDLQPVFGKVELLHSGSVRLGFMDQRNCRFLAVGSRSGGM